MSRINELIQELCPDGVRFYPVGELCEVFSGFPFKSSLFNVNGSGVPVIRIRDVNTGISGTYYSGEFDEKYLVNKGDILIGMDGDFRAVRWGHEAALLNQRVCRLQRFDNRVLPGFVFYKIQDELDRIHSGITGSTVKHLSVRDLQKSRIPVPPIEVQREIVRILDQFTQLEAELERRRQQFEHYRNTLLTFTEEGGRWTTMGEIFEMRAGNAISALEISRCENTQANIACYGGGGLRGYVREPNQLHDRVLIGRQGALCGNVSWAAAPFYATEHAVVVSPKVSMNDRWAFHALAALNLNQYASKSAQPGLSVSRLKLVDIYFPERRQQDRIAKNLDLLQALMREAGIGLPAEIAARRKQYEYYRDKLLTFKELK